jgi:hypothetical protein
MLILFKYYVFPHCVAIVNATAVSEEHTFFRFRVKAIMKMEVIYFSEISATSPISQEQIEDQ